MGAVYCAVAVSLAKLCVGETTNIWPFLKYNVLRGPFLRGLVIHYILGMARYEEFLLLKIHL